MTSYPFSYAERMVDSTQQLVRKPPSMTVSISRLRRMKSRLVVANVSRPRLPSTTMSDSAGAISSQISAPQVPLVDHALQDPVDLVVVPEFPVAGREGDRRV